MKLITLVSVLLVGLCWPGWAAEGKKKKENKGTLQHVVCFKFKDNASETQVQELVKAFGELPNQIKEIKGFEWGTNVSPEKHAKGFTHCFIVTFKTEKARNTYLDHPAHQEFAKLVGPIVADVFVIDFWAQK